ncbi:MAG: NUDIX hydrolase [Nitrospirae bacterium]|nr:NUDIX hydrolase [Nitrospirota bacterium]
MSVREKVKEQVSSGGVIFREVDGRINVGLITRTARSGLTVYCLPKGWIEKDETPEEAAIREVREETGLTGRILNKIGEINYFFYSDKKEKIVKDVHFYLLEYISGITADHDEEVDDAGWFPFEEAIPLLSYKNEREILIKAGDMIRNIISK